MSLHIVILAAGKGSRMHSDLPKALQPLAGRPLLEHVFNTATLLEPQMIHVVYGDGGQTLPQTLSHLDVNWIEQKEQLGSGHALLQVLPHLPSDATVLVLYCDVPCISASTLQDLLTQTPTNRIGILTTELEDSTGFGRILRNDDGTIMAIVEHKDANEDELQIQEVNTGILTAPVLLLQKYLPQIEKNNAQQEYYLTDLIGLCATQHPIHGVIADDEEVLGINTKEQLMELERLYQYNLACSLMQQGVTIIDAERFDARGDLTIAPDVTIEPNVILEKVVIGANSYIGCNNTLRNTIIGENVIIKPNCIIEDTIIEDYCVVGPFAHLRGNTHLKARAEIGNFVEVKKTVVGEHSKAKHLTYLGDTVIGKEVNIGAGTITCNYDGANKHQTIIQDGVFIGSGTQLVAPVTVGENATVGAGSTITEDVPAEQLTLARTRQISVTNWQRPRKNN